MNVGRQQKIAAFGSSYTEMSGLRSLLLLVRNISRRFIRLLQDPTTNGP